MSPPSTTAGGLRCASPTPPASTPPRRQPQAFGASTSSSPTPASAPRAPSPTTTTRSGGAARRQRARRQPHRRAACRSCAGPRLLPWSTASIVPGRDSQRALYGASKGASALTLAMAADHVREGIAPMPWPGTADTPWVGRLLATADPAAERRRSKRQPLGRMVSPEEVAWAICPRFRGRRRRRGRSWPSTAGCGAPAPVPAERAGYTHPARAGGIPVRRMHDAEDLMHVDIADFEADRRPGRAEAPDARLASSAAATAASQLASRLATHARNVLA